MEEIWVEGVPATWETKGEKPWKECLLQVLAPFDKPRCNGTELHFRLPSLAPKGHPLDVDNLCEPEFSVLVSQLGWFSGKRPKYNGGSLPSLMEVHRVFGCFFRVI